MLREVCQAYTDLAPEEIRRLELLADQLPLIAELTAADVFIDCPCGGKAVVAAHARPAGHPSAYTASVVGQFALPEDEPAVFQALKTGLAVCDLKAVTQEGRAVRQNAAPVRGEDGRVIGVLIRERDISAEILQEKKYETLARNYEGQNTVAALAAQLEDPQQAAMREVHHRIKNNLQLVASILNMQSRKCADQSTKRILQENVGRVLSIATIHDILTHHSNDSMFVSSRTLFDKLRMNMQSLSPPGKSVVISVDGDDVLLDVDVATPVSLVITELLTNALEHAFEGRSEGLVTVSLHAGSLYHTVTVADNGIGFDPFDQDGASMGLSIVSATVRDKLKGKLRVSSDDSGTRMSFDFRA